MISKKWLISLGLVVLMVAAFTLASCAPPDPVNDVVDDNDVVADVATEYRIGGETMPANLNMSPEVLMYTNLGCLYLMINYENLSYFPRIDGDPPDDPYDFVPKLATDYTVTYEDGNQVWTISLQEGVTWHDGEDFTADDVVYSLKHVLHKWDLGKPIDWDAVDEDTEWEEIWPEHVLAEADGPHTVILTYTDGWHIPDDFPPTFWAWDPIVPEHVFGPEGEGVYDGWDEDPQMWDGESIGTGPFRVIEFEPDSYTLFERYEDYWGELPAAERVLHRFYDDPGSMFTALEAGAIDTHEDSSVPFPKLEMYEADPEMEVSFDRELSMYYMGFNLHPEAGYEPLQDRVLRQAIAYAIDEQNIVDLVFGGYGEVPTGFIYSESPNHNPDLPDYSQDQEKASELLEDAGYSKENGYWHTPEGEIITFPLTTIPGTLADAGSMITTDLQDFGLDVTHEVIDSTTFVSYLYWPDEGEMDAFIYGEDPGFDPYSDWIWALMSDPYGWGYEWNNTWYNNPEYNDLYMENYLAADLDEKRDILFRMQEILAEDLPLIYLYRADFISGHRTDRWENWYDTIGGPFNWMNEYSIREVTPVE